MDEYEPRPVLMILIPPHFAVRRSGEDALRAWLASEHGASLHTRVCARPLRTCVPLFAGVWSEDRRRRARLGLHDRLEQAYADPRWTGASRRAG